MTFNIPTRINISDIEEFVKDKTFHQIKQDADESNIRVKELRDGPLVDLYLLVHSDEDQDDTALASQCRGVIFEKNTNKVVCMSQNKFKSTETYQHIIGLHQTRTKFTMEYCEDGTVIRLYNYKGLWYTATTKCIDASHSFWSSPRTFNDMFFEIFDPKLSEGLDPSYTYIFVLQHKENRIVVPHDENVLVYISRIHNETKVEDYSDDRQFELNPTIRRTLQIDSTTIHSTQDDYFLPSKRGIICKSYNEPLSTWETYQYDFSQFSRVKQVRGNVPLLRMRYLELLSDPESLLILEENYLEAFFLFAMIKHQMNNLYRSIHALYIDSHCKHNVRVDEENRFYRTLKQLHASYKNTGNPITLQEVKYKVNSLDKNVLKKFLNWV